MRLVIFFLSVFCASTVYAEYPTNNIFCFDVSSTISSEKGPSGLQSLYRILQNEVENEMQVYNNDELTWHLKGDAPSMSVVAFLYTTKNKLAWRECSSASGSGFEVGCRPESGWASYISLASREEWPTLGL